jgi:5'-3' exonuclease
MQVHLVDGTYELFRAYYGAPSRKSRDGSEVGAVAGLARTLLNLVQSEGATHVAVAFDHVIESFRNDLFPGYKTGAGIDPLLLAQFGPAEDVTRALGLTVWSMVEFEADDAIAAAAARFRDDPRVERVILCSPDKDLAQCVRGDRVVMMDRRRGILSGEEGVRAKFGIAPASIPDYLALVGDSADGIPGIPRWGARSASTALAACGHIEDIPDDPSVWPFTLRGAPALAESLRANRPELGLYRTLATLREDVPLAETLDDLEWQGADRAALSAICEANNDSLPGRVVNWRD